MLDVLLYKARRNFRHTGFDFEKNELVEVVDIHLVPKSRGTSSITFEYGNYQIRMTAEDFNKRFEIDKGD